MDFIDELKIRAKTKRMRIVLPEVMDERVLEAAKIATFEEIAEIILIGNKEKILEKRDDLTSPFIHFIEPTTSKHTEKLIKEFVILRRHKGMTFEKAKEILLTDPMYYACMLVKCGLADGVVSGACHSSANTIRPALQIIKTKQDTMLVSAFFFMLVPNCPYGYNGTFIFADAGLEQNPTPEKLAEIAKSSADSFKLLTGEDAIVAMISHSTKNSASHPDVDKVIEATKIANEKYPEYQIDGELQVDAAIVPEVAKLKAPNSKVAGHANVLVFPDLDAGNSGYKLVERLANAKAYGPICQGIASPINDLSRGCSASDIVGVIAITAVQAQEKCENI